MPKKKPQANTANTVRSLVRQDRGGALLTGGVPGHQGAGGRPPELWRKACREKLEAVGGLDFVGDVIAGKVGDEALIGEGKDAKVVIVKPKVRDRLYAVQLLAEHGHGKPPQEIQVDDPKTRPTGDALVARVLELLPRVIAFLPVDKQEIARLFKQRQEIEVLVQGKVVKDGRSGNGNGAGS